MKRGLMLLLLVVLACPWLGAQETQPLLVVREGAKETPLALARVETVVRILGHLAETRMTMTFHNPNSRQLAGDLYFPLPEGTTISGYALDIQGKMVDGVVVEKDKGREIFETEMRKGVDPGLVEWVKGNNFKTRVFPIPANGTRTVMVKYVTELIGDKTESIYHLPLNFKDKVKEFSLRVEVFQNEKAPVVKEGGLANFAFKSWKQGYLAEIEAKNQTWEQDLRLALPAAPAQKVLVEKSPEGDLFFAVSDHPPVPEAVGLADKAPARVRILWDGSASRGKGDRKRELDALRAWFGRFKEASVAVEWVEFRNAAAPAKKLTVRDGNVDDLVQLVESVQYDGGTQMGCLSPLPEGEQPDLFLLFTDGISNFGREEPTGFKAPVYICSGDSGANHAFLRFLAMQTGGEYFNLNRVTPAEAAKAIGQPAFAFLGADFQASEMEEVFPRVPQPVHGVFSAAGRLLAGKGKLTLKYGTNGKVEKSVVVEIDGAGAPEGDLLRRHWAQKKVADLEIFPQRNEKEITAVGKRYSIVTPQTSLLVLERVDQYVEHEVVPPAGMPEWRKEYFAVMEKREADQKRTEDQKLAEVLNWWKVRLAWWEKEFDIPEGFRVHGSADKSAREGATGGSNMAMPSAPSPRSAPPMAEPAPSPSMEMSDGAMPQSAVESESLADSFEGNEKAKKADSGPGGSAGEERTVEPGVAMKAWNPQTPYIKALKDAEPEKAFAVYLKERVEYGNSPAFYLDCSDFFVKADKRDLGLQVLSNIAELELENPPLMRILAHRLEQLEELELASLMFEEVLKLRPEEPQSYRDLGLVLGRMKKFERAVALLWDVVRKTWDGRFPEIEVIALVEMNNFLAKAKAEGITNIKVDERFVKNLDLDARIIMTWDADMTDMDLWVVEPSGEKTYYGNPRSQIGGNVSRDFTRGYGPEEYCLHQAMKGMYTIQTNFFGSQSQTMAGAVTLQADVFTNYGRPNEKRRSITLRLTDRQETFTVAEIEY